MVREGETIHRLGRGMAGVKTAAIKGGETRDAEGDHTLPIQEAHLLPHLVLLILHHPEETVQSQAHQVR